jgi:Raf kinase inhibitor-like YbhB/YbcL family protein
MKLTIDNFENGGRIPDKYAFCRLDESGKVQRSKNINPALHWTNAPSDARSFAIICFDPDVPASGEYANKEGMAIPKDHPRTEFYHWAMVDISFHCFDIPEGAESSQVIPGGKPGGKTKYGVRGRNDYTDFLKGDEEMEGDYFGYDGPCPPWNDDKIHNYIFRVYALTVESLNLPEMFTAQMAMKALAPHVMDFAEYTGTYTLNKNLIDMEKGNA